jgi:hypothetical protein
MGLIHGLHTEVRIINPVEHAMCVMLSVVQHLESDAV